MNLPMRNGGKQCEDLHDVQFYAAATGQQRP